MGYFNNGTLSLNDSFLKLAIPFEKPLANVVNFIDASVSGDDDDITIVDGKKGMALTFPTGPDSSHYYLSGKDAHGISGVGIGAGYGFFFSMWIQNNHEFLYSGDLFRIGGLSPSVGLYLEGRDSTLTDSSVLYFYILDSNRVFKVVKTNISVDTPRWIHIFGVYSAVEGMRLYVDGSMVGLVPYTDYAKDCSLDTMTIGYGSGTDLDEFYFWDGIALQGPNLDNIINLLRINFLTQLIARIDETLNLDTVSLSSYIAILSETLNILQIDSTHWTGSRTISEILTINDNPWQGIAGIIEFTLGLSDALSTRLSGQNTYTETLVVYDSLLCMWKKALAESLSLTSSLDIKLGIIVEEWIGFLQSNITNWRGRESINEIIKTKIASEMIGLFSRAIEENLVLTDSLDRVVSVIVDEWMTFLDVTDSKWNGAEIVAESFKLNDDDTVAKLFIELIEDGFTISDSLSVIIKLLLKESISFASTQLARGEFQKTVNENLSILDTVVRSWLEELVETLGMEQALTVSWLFSGTITENMALSDDVTPKRTSFSSLSEALQITTAMSASATLHALIQETLNTSLSIELDGAVWQAWVLNTSSFHPSIYSGFDFNSYCVYKGNAYGAKSDGIYQLDGSTDDGRDIRTGISIPTTQFGTSRNKRFRKAYLGISGGSPSIKFDTDNGSRIYNVVDTKVNVGRNLKGKNWTIQAQDFDTMDFIELIPVILTR